MTAALAVFSWSLDASKPFAFVLQPLHVDLQYRDLIALSVPDLGDLRRGSGQLAQRQQSLQAQELLLFVVP